MEPLNEGDLCPSHPCTHFVRSFSAAPWAWLAFFELSAGDGFATAAELDYPVSLASGPNGDPYLGDANGQPVQRASKRTTSCGAIHALSACYNAAK
jgi:hypothetical protein